jgi:hypothetical protein
MDDRNGNNERHGTVPNHHSVSALLQLPRRLRQVPGELKAEVPSRLYFGLTSL